MDKYTQFDRDQIKEEDIIEDLVTLGFFLNDARVYFSLLLSGPNKPVRISELSGVDRSRVYDSLRRLVKKGYVEEEPVKRGPFYRATNPHIILREIGKEFRMKLELASTLEKTMQKYEPILKKPYLVSIIGENKIFKEILSLIATAENYIQIALTPDFSMNRHYLLQIVDALVEKKRLIPNIRIEIALNHQEGKYQNLLIKMHEYGILIYLWYIGNVLPYGLYISEKTYIFTTLDKIDAIPTYNIGLTTENAQPDMIEGYRQLFLFNNASYFKQGKMKQYSISQKKEELKEFPEDEGESKGER